MSFLLRLLVVIGVLWIVISATGVLKPHKPHDQKQKTPSVKQSDQIRKELELNVEQFQQKLDDAMQQSGAAQ
ncbi:MAG: hypothetical protein ACR2QW_14970 [bacterium]